jgi:hypothetical protein
MPEDNTQATTVVSRGWRSPTILIPVVWGVVWGLIQVVSPFVIWWLTPSVVYALELVLIASVYIGFAVADGRRHVMLVEIVIASLFVIIAAAAATGPSWLLVVGLVAHGFKDLWQHRSQFLANTRWWPPFCAAVDWVTAAILATALLTGVNFDRY